MPSPSVDPQFGAPIDPAHAEALKTVVCILQQHADPATGRSGERARQLLADESGLSEYHIDIVLSYLLAERKYHGYHGRNIGYWMKILPTWPVRDNVGRARSIERARPQKRLSI